MFLLLIVLVLICRLAELLTTQADRFDKTEVSVVEISMQQMDACYMDSPWHKVTFAHLIN